MSDALDGTGRAAAPGGGAGEPRLDRRGYGAVAVLRPWVPDPGAARRGRIAATKAERNRDTRPTAQDRVVELAKEIGRIAAAWSDAAARRASRLGKADARCRAMRHRARVAFYRARDLERMGDA